MSPHILESDWKLLRDLSRTALGRLCKRILDEATAVCGDEAKSNHERYLALYKLIHERDKDIAQAFNGLRRSSAIVQLGAMRALDLLTEEEFSRFSEETRRIVETWLR
jgi:hypothetical protein